MSAALENVSRGDTELAEVTSLASTVRAWNALAPRHRAQAILTPEGPLIIDGAALTCLTGDGIAVLAERLPL
ncbi:hypothetical protein [Sphingomonas sp.]|uniref:hypothetical protein n=1 Tax=Sphingomonas sp. TaxID=28214 RepID=UPI0025DC966C|nr:hypothetical protein [Sphingomonas sp.]